MKLTISLLCLFAAYAVSEPPVPGYLPPKNDIPPLSSTYGLPNQRFQPPSQEYGVPSNTYGPPSNTYRPPQNNLIPSQNYGPPQPTFRAPSQNYGPPSQNYGPPNFRAPSPTYGAPGFGQRFGGSSKYLPPPSPTYGTPSAPIVPQLPSVEIARRINTPKIDNTYLPARVGGGFNNGYDNYAQNGGYDYSRRFRGRNGEFEDEYSEPANYHFEYMVNDPPSGSDFGHEETRQGNNAVGRYFVLLPDGRKQIVEYEANELGYKPKISYEDVFASARNGIFNGYNRNGYNGQNGGYVY